MTKTMRIFLLGTAATIGYALVMPAYAGDTAPLKVKAVEFTATPAPANALEMTQPYTRSQAVVTLHDQRRQALRHGTPRLRAGRRHAQPPHLLSG